MAGTVFDLRTPTLLGDALPQCPGGDNNGFDHNFVLANTESDHNFVCRVEHPQSGQYRCLSQSNPYMRVLTNGYIIHIHKGPNDVLVIHIQ